MNYMYSWCNGVHGTFTLPCCMYSPSFCRLFTYNLTIIVMFVITKTISLLTFSFNFHTRSISNQNNQCQTDINQDQGWLQPHDFLNHASETFKAWSYECRMSLCMGNECHFLAYPLISVSCTFDPLNIRSSLGNVRCLCMLYFSFINVIRF